MPEPPEEVDDKATPDQLLERLEVFGERHRLGLMTAAEFTAVLRLFQFTDAVGHVWAPGARTKQWYRWDRTHWTPAEPPQRLIVPPVHFEELPKAAAPRPSPARQAAPGARTPAAAPPVAAAATSNRTAPSPPARDTCPKCGAVMPGKRYCTLCGASLARSTRG
jgi:hypothetical protein